MAARSSQGNEPGARISLRQWTNTTIVATSDYGAHEAQKFLSAHLAIPILQSGAALHRKNRDRSASVPREMAMRSSGDAAHDIDKVRR